MKQIAILSLISLVCCGDILPPRQANVEPKCWEQEVQTYREGQAETRILRHCFDPTTGMNWETSRRK